MSESDFSAVNGKMQAPQQLIVPHHILAPTNAIPPPSIDSSGRLEVPIDRDLDDHTKAQELIAALHKVNDPPSTYQCEGKLARIRRDSNGPHIQFLDRDILKAHMGSRLVPCVYEAGKRKPVRIRPELAAEILHQESWPFPRLNGIVHSPVYSPDGILETKPGYNAAAGVFVSLEGSLDLTVPESPTAEDITKAKSLISDGLLVDFPFLEASSKTHAIALGLLPFVRPMIDGPTPLHIVDATQRGTGKGLLSKSLALVATGRPPIFLSAPEKKSEWDQRIFSTLLSAPCAIVIDNISSRLDSDALAMALTSETYTCRVLGKSQVATVPNLTAWVANGNQVELSTDIARRSVLIRLEAAVERPWERSEFKHSDLIGWVTANRAELLWAFLVLVQAWIAAGRPPGGQHIGSFESWSRVIGGILECVGIEGFLGNRTRVYDRMDLEAGEWKQFVLAWRQYFGERTVNAGQLVDLGIKRELMFSLTHGECNAGSKTRLGKALSKYEGRIIGGWRIVKDYDSHTKTALYRLEAA